MYPYSIQTFLECIHQIRTPINATENCFLIHQDNTLPNCIQDLGPGYMELQRCKQVSYRSHDNMMVGIFCNSLLMIEVNGRHNGKILACWRLVLLLRRLRWSSLASTAFLESNHRGTVTRSSEDYYFYGATCKSWKRQKQPLSVLLRRRRNGFHSRRSLLRTHWSFYLVKENSLGQFLMDFSDCRP